MFGPWQALCLFGAGERLVPPSEEDEGADRPCEELQLPDPITEAARELNSALRYLERLPIPVARLQ
jgi:hypothetical protein